MMSRENGQSIELFQSIKQSIQDILTTPIGSRVMRREYGSMIFKLLDQPFNDAVRLQVMAASATAILTWENRVNLSSAKFTLVENGKFQVDLDARIIGTFDNKKLSIPLQMGSSI